MKKQKRVTLPTISCIDITPERIERAHAADLTVGAKQYRKIETPVQAALRYKWITRTQADAVEQLQSHMRMSVCRSRTTMSWVAAVDCGHSNDGDDGHLTHEKHFRNAVATLPAKYRTAIVDWLVAAETEDTNVVALGAQFTRFNDHEAMKAIGVHVLCECADVLAEHFGLSKKIFRSSQKRLASASTIR